MGAKNSHSTIQFSFPSYLNYALSHLPQGLYPLPHDSKLEKYAVYFASSPVKLQRDILGTLDDFFSLSSEEEDYCEAEKIHRVKEHFTRYCINEKYFSC